MTTQKSIKCATNGQKDQIAAMVAALVKKLIGELGVNQEGARKLISGGTAFRAALRDPLMEAIRAHCAINMYADEEVPSSYGYLSGYKPRPVAEQMATLKSIFPQLKSFDESAAAKELLAGPEGNFLIPRWQEIAPTYGEAVELVLAALKKSRNGKFSNYRENQLGPDRLRESAKKADMFQKLGDEQKGHDVLVVQAQFGIKRRGKSVRRARIVMGGNECGLGAFEIGIMLLTHPDRLARYHDLCIDCAGDKYAPHANRVFLYAPHFNYISGRLGFLVCRVDDPLGLYGSASAFMPPVVVPSD